jgi:hypothetical protein
LPERSHGRVETEYEAQSKDCHEKSTTASWNSCGQRR